MRFAGNFNRLHILIYTKSSKSMQILLLTTLTTFPHHPPPTPAQSLPVRRIADNLPNLPASRQMVCPALHRHFYQSCKIKLPGRAHGIFWFLVLVVYPSFTSLCASPFFTWGQSPTFYKYSYIALYVKGREKQTQTLTNTTIHYITIYIYILYIKNR